MIVAAVCMSHTPYMDRARAAREVEQRFFAAASRMSKRVGTLAIDAVVVVHPDHFNGFFYNMMPPFCIGLAGRSIGDYGTVEGELPVAVELATDLLNACLDDGIDLAFTHRMEVDHGFAQPLEMLFAETPLPGVIPLFVNCAAAPRPRPARARALGEAIGRWASGRPERILIIGSGGLSHDPPIPRLEKMTGEHREKLIAGGRSSFAARLARQSHVFAVGEAYVAGTGETLPINEEWDREALRKIEAGDLEFLDGASEDELARLAGGGANEVRTWLVALSALASAGPYRAQTEFYAPIPEWITGTAIVFATQS